ncbi:ABC transporter substrate-binding protein [Jannaschia sp. W003]|uniref:ABC transporter substrate-binding protein n=1 Tax=Jannaschia sp. W003 TaxID=2867012 RepID=UPI0021A8B578|nr:ABC transporter substrate-binding protein [Jannaschia sp. W003]UWQ20927.1 ABC transporter substrate-binding protein [Jannaschia sp. W003]
MIRTTAALALLTAPAFADAHADPEGFREAFLAGDVAWADVEARARAEGEVAFYHWGGSDLLNGWMDSVVVPALAERGVTLRPVRITGTKEAVDLVLAEKASGKDLGQGSVDAIWLNGENFATLKRQDALFGGFAPLLPEAAANVAFDPADPASGANLRDFGVETGGAEVPWSAEQYVCARNAARMDGEPPRDFDALRAYLEANPGKFTYVKPPHYVGNTFVQAALYAMNPDGTGAEPYQRDVSEFEPAELARLMAPAMDYLAGIEPLLASAGRYPEDAAALDGMFLNGEIDVACKFGIFAAATDSATGIWPAEAEHFVFPEGAMIRNKSFLAIPANAPNPAAALVLADWMTSLKAQATKLRDVGYPAGIDGSMLDDAANARLAEASPGLVGITQEELDANAAPDTNASLVDVIEAVWLERIEQGSDASLEEIVARAVEARGAE